MTLEFLDRPSGSAHIARVWRSRSSSRADVMLAVAHTGWDLVVWRDAAGTHAGLQGPQREASIAPVPPSAEFLGVRFTATSRLGSIALQPRPGEFISLPADDDGFELDGKRWRHPQFEDVETLIEELDGSGLLLGDDGYASNVSIRTIQRRFKRATGMTPSHARQVTRARSAAVDLISGEGWESVCLTHGFYDQAHLARSLRRFIGLSPTALHRHDDTHPPLSFLYKTGDQVDS